MNHVRHSGVRSVFLFVPCVLSLWATVRAADPADSKTFSPFGIGASHVNNRSAEDNARWIPQMAEIGIHFHRTANTGWGAVEPEEGKWKWDALDKQMKYLE